MDVFPGFAGGHTDIKVGSGGKGATSYHFKCLDSLHSSVCPVGLLSGLVCSTSRSHGSSHANVLISLV